MKKNKIIILFLIPVLKFVSQQNSVYTNFLMNAYIYNPAIAGSDDGFYVNMLYRNQWMGFSNDAPKTFILNGYSSFKRKPQMAVGAQIMNDKTGLLNKSATHISYAYHLKINSKIKIGFGLSAGISQIRVRLYDVKMYDSGDEVLTGNILNSNAFDMHSGLLLYGKQLFIGISAVSMVSTKYNYVNAIGKNVPVYYVHSGYKFKITKDIECQPLVLIKFSQPVPYQPEYMLKFQWKEIFWIAASYRTYSNVSAMFGVNMLDNKLKFGYAYDYSINSIQRYNSGSHEIFIGHVFKRKDKTKEEQEFLIPDNSIKQSIKNKNNKKDDE